MIFLFLTQNAENIEPMVVVWVKDYIKILAEVYLTKGIGRSRTSFEVEVCLFVLAEKART